MSKSIILFSWDVKTTHQLELIVLIKIFSSLSPLLFLCRICHCEGDSECPLIMPCRCTGSLSFVHQSCLNQWIKSSDTRCCELCKFDFVMETKLKPLRKVEPSACSSITITCWTSSSSHCRMYSLCWSSLRCHPSFLQWEKLNMSKNERRKIFCSVMFHVIAIVCMLWSVYVLVRRTAEEIRLGKNGQLPPSLPILHPCHSVSHTKVLTGSPAVFAYLHWNYWLQVALLNTNASIKCWF